MSGQINDLFGKPISVINVGLASMAEAVQAQNLPVLDVDWRPPLDGVPVLRFTASGVNMDTANAETCQRIKQGRPVLVGMGIARDLLGMHPHLILHAGPPVTWERMCGPQRGAVIGALIYEGLAQAWLCQPACSG